MGQVSKYPISKPVYEQIFEIFLKTLVKIKDKQEAKRFIEDLLTPTERIMLVKRLAIAFLLEKGYGFREISKILRVSLPTIASVSLVRKYGGQGYQKMVKRLLSEEKIKDFLLQIGEVLTEIGAKAPITSGGGTWRYLHREIQKRRREKVL
jgi:uncharacterized protein YerC